MLLEQGESRAPDPTCETGRGLAAVYRHVLNGGDGAGGIAVARLAMNIRKQCNPPTDNCPVTRAAYALGHLGFFEHQIDQLYGMVVAPRLVIQASAVRYERGCVLLAGKSGSGKSALAALLVRRGLGYVANSFVCLDSGSAVRTWAHLAKAVPLKGAFLGALPDVTPCASFENAGEAVRYVDPEHLSPGCVALEPVPVAVVVFPQYTPGAEAVLRPVTSGEVALSLNANVVKNGSSFAQLVELSRGVRAFRLEFGTLEEGCEAVILAAEGAAKMQAG